MKPSVGESRDASPLFNNSLLKGLSVLAAFGHERRTMNLPEIAQATGIGKSAAQRLAYTLERLGYLRKDPTSRRYALTTKVLELGMRYVHASPLIETATPYLLDLNTKIGETVNLSEPSGLDMVFVVSFPGHKQISVQLPIGDRYPMYCTAAGRAYLSGLTRIKSDALVESSELRRYTPATILDPTRIKELIDRARSAGYAFAEGEVFRGDINLAAPVFGRDGTPVAAVGVSVPVTRWSFERAVSEIAPEVLDAARAISSPTSRQHYSSPL
ncbi:MAG: transcriptional regulator [Alphaproteobacteria bacterium]|nr:MAG: transcriptional regulator [Alphaproteobacteria bacterium]